MTFVAIIYVRHYVDFIAIELVGLVNIVEIDDNLYIWLFGLYWVEFGFRLIGLIRVELG